MMHVTQRQPEAIMQTESRKQLKNFSIEFLLDLNSESEKKNKRRREYEERPRPSHLFSPRTDNDLVVGGDLKSQRELVGGTRVEAIGKSVHLFLIHNQKSPLL